MAPTIGRQWRGGAEDYAALCDYCSVRYLRSQLSKQEGGRLACMGPGTNGCGAGRDEVTLDKINADIMRNRRRPTVHLGGRFDHIRTSIKDIFGSTLAEYWDAREGVTSTSLGVLTAWTGQKLGMTLSPEVSGGGRALWSASSPDFFGRASVSVTAGILESDTGALLPSGARPFIGLVARHALEQGTLGFSLIAGAVETAKAGIYYPGALFTFAGLYASAMVPTGTTQYIPRAAVGNVHHGRLFELDATGPVAFRAGTAEASSSVNSPTDTFWNRVTVSRGLELTLLVLANNPSPEQIDEFRALARSCGGRLG